MKRTVRAVFCSYRDGDVTRTAMRGEEIEVSKAEAERLDKLGAFEGSPAPAGPRGVAGHFGNQTGLPPGVPTEPANEPGESDGVDPADLEEAEAQIAEQEERIRQLEAELAEREAPTPEGEPES
jgi:hypothetical protein